MGIRLSATTDSQVLFNDILVSGAGLTGGYGLNVKLTSTGAQFKNNAISFSAGGSGGLTTATVRMDNTSMPGFQSDYNILFSSNSTNSSIWGGAVVSLPQWRVASRPGRAFADGQPQVEQPRLRRRGLHALSQAGRWDPAGPDLRHRSSDLADVDRADPGRRRQRAGPRRSSGQHRLLRQYGRGLEDPGGLPARLLR